MILGSEYSSTYEFIIAEYEYSAVISEYFDRSVIRDVFFAEGRLFATTIR